MTKLDDQHDGEGHMHVPTETKHMGMGRDMR